MGIFTLKKIGGNIFFCFQLLPFKLLLAEPSTKLASKFTDLHKKQIYHFQINNQQTDVCLAH